MNNLKARLIGQEIIIEIVKSRIAKLLSQSREF